ncbi:Exportin-4 [Liparis tanakae]|uniref:Exportin-4 n=1 Tax=Liparis tanakae TaxID=230148 RepID=A0A4Z2E932_9TELE|nr:Exportin-4 [Liparis tanakae]
MPSLALTAGGSLGRHYIAMFEATQSVTLKPTESWREALLDTRVMDLFFTVSPYAGFMSGSSPPPPTPPPPPLSDMTVYSEKQRHFMSGRLATSMCVFKRPDRLPDTAPPVGLLPAPLCSTLMPLHQHHSEVLTGLSQ